MAINSKDLEVLWERFSSEGVRQGISVRQYFESNGVPYHVFERWYKKKFQQPGIVECKVEGVPSDPSTGSSSSPSSANGGGEVTVNNLVIYLSNGLKIEQRRLSYSQLLSFIQKLQALCSA